eukprot:SAG22_NODE_790_length_7216_cov_5.198820_11_plen_163_part_00
MIILHVTNSKLSRQAVNDFFPTPQVCHDYIEAMTGIKTCETFDPFPEGEPYGPGWGGKRSCTCLATPCCRHALAVQPVHWWRKRDVHSKKESTASKPLAMLLDKVRIRRRQRKCQHVWSTISSEQLPRLRLQTCLRTDRTPSVRRCLCGSERLHGKDHFNNY